MCGIAGIAAFREGAPPDHHQLARMAATLVHRGPDDEGSSISDGVGLTMRRLAVIDLETGRQPLANEDGSVVAVSNGEIYNFRELRVDLEARGHRFATQSDTEVIVHAYEEYGSDFPNRLNGMFAIAVHDRKRGRLFLIRDHLGIKPLYYADTGKHLIWGSEIKAILASGLVERQLSVDALGQFMSWEYVPGTDTLFEDIHKLGPGEMLELNQHTGLLSKREYWDIPQGCELGSLAPTEWEDAVDEKLTECVRRQLVSDVPLGAFLSGGVDSSLIAASMNQPETFSIGFEDPTYNELPYSRTVANHLQTNHHTEVVNADVAELFDRLLYLLDDPIGDFSIFPTYLLSKVARQRVTVALSGDGGDELFGGYETYVADGLAQSYGRLPSWLRNAILEPAIGRLRPRSAKKGLINKALRFMEGLGHDKALAHARWRLFVGELARSQLFTKDALDQMETSVGAHIYELHRKAGPRDQVNTNLYVDCKSYLPDNILTKVDRMSMGVSLETRVPFLDKELVSMAFAMPGDLKIRKRHSKFLLKRVAARHVPHECVYRAKEGFSIPMKAWLNSRFQPLLEELTSRKRLEAEGLFSWRTVDRLKHEHLNGQANHSHILWSLVVFQAWRDRWLTDAGNNAGIRSMK